MKNKIFAKIREEINSTRKEFYVLLVVAAIALIISEALAAHRISEYVYNTSQARLRRAITLQGHDVQDIDFQFVKNGIRQNQRIYQSSQPLYHRDYYVSLWKVTTTRRLFSFGIASTTVQPYYSKAINKPL